MCGGDLHRVSKHSVRCLFAGPGFERCLLLDLGFALRAVSRLHKGFFEVCGGELILHENLVLQYSYTV